MSIVPTSYHRIFLKMVDFHYNIFDNFESKNIASIS